MAAICPDELEYFIDLAMNESQRWLETVTRERFLDEDDFLYSVRYGTQLRKLLNKLRPGSFSLPNSNGEGNDDDTSCSDHEYDEPVCTEQRLKYTLEHGDQDEEGWIPTFLRICRTILGIPPQRLFRPSDLDFTVEDREREGCLSTELLDRVRRVVVTVAELAQLFETTVTVSGPRIDKSALEALIRYHDHLWLTGHENDHCLSAYSSPRIKRTASTRDSVAARRKAASKLSQISTTSQGERDASLDNDDDDTEFRPVNDDSPFKDFRSQLNVSTAISFQANMDTAQLNSSEDTASYWTPNELRMLMRPLHSPNVESHQYGQGNHEIDHFKSTQLMETENTYSKSAQLIDEGSFESEYRRHQNEAVEQGHRFQLEEHQDRYEPRRIEQAATEPKSYSGEERLPSISSESMVNEGLTTKGEFEQSSEYSRSTSPDRASSSVFDASSVITTASMPMSASVTTLGGAQKDWNKQEKRTVRSTKNGKEIQQAKILRRASAAIVAPAVPANPLKYIQAKSDLDLRARALIDKAKENKKKRSQMKIEEQEQEWAADLENWKLRRSSSLATVRRNQSEGDELVHEHYDYDPRRTVSTSENQQDSDPTTAVTSFGLEHSGISYSLDIGKERRLIEPVSPASATVGAKSEMTDLQQNTNEMNGEGEATIRTGTSRLPIVASGGDRGDIGPLSTRPPVHSGTPPLTNNNKTSPNDKTTLARSNGTSVKTYTQPIMHQNIQQTNGSHESNSPSEKFQALRSTYDSAGTMNTDVFHSRPIMKQTDTSRIVPVYAKIPTVEETGTDSGVDSYRPESLTPSRDSHESLSPGSQGSADHSTTRKSSTEQIDFGLRPSKAVLGGGNSYRPDVRTWDTFETKEENTAKEYLITLEQKREKGDKGFGFTLKGGHEKGEPVVVDFILSGSPADKSRMRQGDELLEIDGMDVSKAYLAMINATISQAAKAGSIELKLRRLGKRSDQDRSAENGKSPARYEKKTDESSFDQKRLQFEKAAVYEPPRAVPTTTRPALPIRHQNEYRHPSPFTNPATSPPPVNRQDYEAAKVGQLVARYAGAEESRFRSVSYDRDSRISREPEKKPVAKAVNAADSLEKTSSPFSERRRNPGKVTDFVPEVDRSSSSPSTARSPRRFSPGSDSDYRVTSIHSRNTPGNILNFVPESERSKAKVDGDNLTKQRNALEDREEIDQRWQRERARVLGLTSEEKNGTGEKKEFYFKPEAIRNVGLNHLGLPTSKDTRRINSSFTDVHSGRSLSPPRVAPPPPPVDDDDTDFYRDNQAISNASNLPSSRRYLTENTEHTRPFGHVRHSPIAFSYEPVPATKHGVHETEIIGGNKKLSDTNGRGTPPIKTEESRMPKSLDTESASRKLDDLLRKQQRQNTEVELQYLEMAASAAASGVDISPYRPGMKTESGRTNDINQHWLVREAEDLRLTDQLRQERSNLDAPSLKSQPPQETRRHSSTTAPNMQQQGLNDQMSASMSALRRPPSPKYPSGLMAANRYTSASSSGKSDILPIRQTQKSLDDEQQVVAVSATHRCSHCDKELGRGAAMIIESLNLFFHLGCFKCYVCGTALSDGAQGADVRVRAHRLHCQRCYSNEDAGLQFSEV